jgi:hypothetical protein
MSWKIRTTVLWVKIGVVFLISSDAAPSSCIQPLYADTSDILPLYVIDKVIDCK